MAKAEMAEATVAAATVAAATAVAATAVAQDRTCGPKNYTYVPSPLIPKFHFMTLFRFENTK